MKPLLAVTTLNRRCYEEYGHRCIESFKNWPSNARLVCYAEGFEPTGVEVRDLHASCPDLLKFKRSMQEYVPPDWRMDVVKFSNKVFAAIHAFYDFDGIGVWLDADCITYNKIPEGMIEGLLDGRFLAHFGRKRPLYTETGFWIMDCSHEHKRKFLDEWKSFYTKRRVFDLPEWHDCITFDIAKKDLEKEGLFKTKSLTDETQNDFHPISVHELGKYIDHTKGRRKKMGYSPENKWHAHSLPAAQVKTDTTSQNS